MRVVISFGGSLINPGTPDTKLLLEMARIIKKSSHSFGIVCGGGTVAREYAEAMREVGGERVRRGQGRSPCNEAERRAACGSPSRACPSMRS